MKKKGLFLLASMLMAGGLVGGTFALWAVTDNADPLSIKVSTGSIISDETQYVTIGWGSQKQLGNVGNLGLSSIRKAGVLDLIAETTSEDTFEGLLSASVAFSATTSKLDEKLHVEIYKGNVADVDGEVASLPGSGKVIDIYDGNVTDVDKASIQPLIGSDKHNLYTVLVYLDESTTADDLEGMNGVRATVTIGWDVDPELIAPNKELFVKGFGEASPKVYAWSNTGAKFNDQSWPGVAMTPVAGRPGYYSVVLPTEFDNVIFNNGGDDPTVKTANLKVSETFGNLNNLYTVSGEPVEGIIGGAASALQEAEYYLMGLDFFGWSTQGKTAEQLAPYKFTMANGEGKIEGLTLTAKSTNDGVHEDYGFKVYNPIDNTWFGVNGENAYVASAGTYDITFKFAGPTHLVATPVAA